jgi:hypothetical protein
MNTAVVAREIFESFRFLLAYLDWQFSPFTSFSPVSPFSKFNLFVPLANGQSHGQRPHFRLTRQGNGKCFIRKMARVTGLRILFDIFYVGKIHLT